MCVRARGREMGHKRDSGGARGLPEHSFDCCFRGVEFGFKWAILVGEERSSGAFMATVAPQKGDLGYFTCDRIWTSLMSMGVEEIEPLSRPIRRVL